MKKHKICRENAHNFLIVNKEDMSLQVTYLCYLKYMPCHLFILESSHMTDSLKEGAICKDFLNGICLRGIINCQLEHPEYGKSYLWQFKEDSVWPFRKHGWSNVSSELNDAIEEYFSDPNYDHFSDG